MSAAVDQYRESVIRVVRARLDPRLRRRFDPEDVAQDVLSAAIDQMEGWEQAGKSVHACLYRLTRDRLSQLYRDHLLREKRTVRKEESRPVLADESVMDLASQIVSPGTSPSAAALRLEVRDQVRAALALLNETDREVLVMRMLEGLSARDAAEVLGVSESAVDMRQVRALQHMRPLLLRLRGDESP